MTVVARNGTKSHARAMSGMDNRGGEPGPCTSGLAEHKVTGCKYRDGFRRRSSDRFLSAHLAFYRRLCFFLERPLATYRTFIGGDGRRWVRMNPFALFPARHHLFQCFRHLIAGEEFDALSDVGVLLGLSAPLELHDEVVVTGDQLVLPWRNRAELICAVGSGWGGEQRIAPDARDQHYARTRGGPARIAHHTGDFAGDRPQRYGYRAGRAVAQVDEVTLHLDM